MSIVVTYLKSCPDVFKVTYLKILVKFFWENDESHSEKLCYRSRAPLELTSVKHCFLGIFGNLKYSLLSVLSGSGHHALCKTCDNTGLDFVIIFLYIGWIWYLKNSVAEVVITSRHWIRRCISMAVFSRYMGK